MRKFKSNHTVFLISFIIAILSYFIYLYFRGFGWDGDSFISASQYQKLISSDLYGTIDGGAHPKIFSVLLFGFIYQYSGGFYLLTIISIIINAFAIALLVYWVKEECGLWLVALTGILINIPWTKIVINCDNPAFSVPLIIFGLYSLYRQKLLLGSALLTFSNLFRTGAEFIIFILFVIAIFNRNYRTIVILGISFIIASLHTYFGYILIYPSKEQFWSLAWSFLTTDESIAKYQFSANSLIPYCNSILKQISNKYSIIFILPAIIGLFNIFSKSINIKLILLLPISSLILPISSFIYGTEHSILETKHMGYSILLPVLASFVINKSFLDKLNFSIKKTTAILIFIAVLTFSAFTGYLKYGEYETNTDGTGTLGWTNLIDVKNKLEETNTSNKLKILTHYNFLTFTFLDLGSYASAIDIIKNKTELDSVNLFNYDVIIFPINWNFDYNQMLGTDYNVITNKSIICYLKTNSD